MALVQISGIDVGKATGLHVLEGLRDRPVSTSRTGNIQLPPRHDRSRQNYIKYKSALLSDGRAALSSVSPPDMGAIYTTFPASSITNITNCTDWDQYNCTDDNSTCSSVCYDPVPSIPKYWDIISYEGVRIAIALFFLVALLAAIFGNTCVLLIVYRKRSLRRNATILFICNLALCDLISCLLYRPLFIVELFLPFKNEVDEAYDHLTQCKVTTYFQSVFAGVILHTMMTISLERLLLIVRPLHAKRLCTSRNTIYTLLLIWFLSSCCTLPLPIIFTELMVVDICGVVVSFCGYFSGGRPAIIFFSITFALYFALPLVVMTFSYSKIFVVLHRSSSTLGVREHDKNSGAAKTMRKRRSLARMMLSISILFALTCGPNFIFMLYVATGGEVSSNGFFIATIMKFLPLISSAINPYIYTLSSKTFRNGFKSLLCRKKYFDDSSFGRSFMSSQSNLRRKSGTSTTNRTSVTVDITSSNSRQSMTYRNSSYAAIKREFLEKSENRDSHTLLEKDQQEEKNKNRDKDSKSPQDSQQTCHTPMLSELPEGKDI